MPSSNLQLIMEKISLKLQDQITPSGTLSFLNSEQDPVVVTNEKPEDSKFKNYKRYQIVIYPPGVAPYDETQKLGNMVSRDYSIGLTLYRKAQKGRRMLIFSNPNDLDAGVGLLEFCNLVMDILRYNTLDGTVLRRSRNMISAPAFVSTGEQGVETADLEFYCEVLSSNAAIA